MRTLLGGVLLVGVLVTSAGAQSGQPFQALREEIDDIRSQLTQLQGGSVQPQIDALSASVDALAALIGELQATVADIETSIASSGGSGLSLKTLYTQRALAAGQYLIAEEVCPVGFLPVSGGLVPTNGVYLAGTYLKNYGASTLDPALTINRTQVVIPRSTLTYTTTVYTTVVCLGM